MPRPPRRTKPARGDGRRALLEAVVRVVARQGPDALTYRAVAQEAGVTHGLVSYHFGSRDAMIDEALHWAVDEATRESSIGEEAGLIEQFGASLPQLVDEHADAQAFQHQLHYETDRSATIRDGVLALRRHYLEVIQASLERLGLGGDEALARLVLAVLDGLVMQQLVFRDPALTAGALERLQHLLVLARDHGLGETAQPRVDAA